VTRLVSLAIYAVYALAGLFSACFVADSDSRKTLFLAVEALWVARLDKQALHGAAMIIRLEVSAANIVFKFAFCPEGKTL
jgi:hypothetical protein